MATTVMTLVTAYASAFALMLGYSRVPYAAALDGAFFRWFGVLHPRHEFPHRSLVLVGVLCIVASFFSLVQIEVGRGAAPWPRGLAGRDRRRSHRAVLMTREVAAQMIERRIRPGVVINISSVEGKHGKAVYDFVKRHARLLDSKQNAFFSVNIVARKPNKNTPETNRYLRKFLRQIEWQPKALAVFAGKLDYPRYGFFDRLMIRFIMLLTKGPTDPKAVIEFTDWQQVEAFGRRIGALQDR